MGFKIRNSGLVRSEKWVWRWLLLIFCVVPFIALITMVILQECYHWPTPSTSYRVKALEAQVQKLQEEVKQQEELRQEAVFGLWETINATEQKCDECIHSCGGLD